MTNDEIKETPMRVWLAALVALLGMTAAAQAQYGDISDVKLLKPEDKEHAKSVPPPASAVVLFDGKNLDGWVKTNGKDAAAWKLVDGGAMEVKGGNIMTKRKFGGSFKLHVKSRV